MAFARFLDGDFAAARDGLLTLGAQKPGFEPARRDLLLARALEQLGDGEAALQRYEALTSHPGEEIPCRRALLLKKLGRGDEAKEAFAGILARAKRLSDAEKKDERRWIELARKNCPAA